MFLKSNYKAQKSVSKLASVRFPFFVETKPQREPVLPMEKPASTNVAVTSPVFPSLPTENERVAALRSYHILDSAEDKDYDDLTQLASVICQTPIAMISLVDDQRQWFKSRKGLNITQTPKELSFCAHAIASPERVMIVKDAKQDERFATIPLVTGETDITFYAGVPLINNEGFALGSLCVVDIVSRELTTEQINALTVLAKQVVDKLELRRKLIELETANSKLNEAYTSLQTAHTKINNTENRFRSLVEQAPVAIATLVGRELMIELANCNILYVWGKDKSVIGKPLHIALPELEGQPFLKILDDVYTSGKAYYGYEAKVILPQNGILTDKFFNFVYEPLPDSTGQIGSILVVASEVTEQVNARKALADSNQRLEIALDAGKLGSYDRNLLTGEIFCTDQCRNLFGLPKDGVFHFSDMLEAIVPEQREYVRKLIDAAVANHSVYSSEFQITWRDGTSHWIAAFGKPCYDQQGIATHIIGVTYEITERKTIEQQKDDFLSIASHELKTPLTSLKGALQLLDHLKDKPFNPNSSKLVELANKSVEKMISLVDQVLNINRIDHDHLDLNKSRFVVSELLTKCCHHVRVDGKHELIFQGDETLAVYADEDRIEQVIVNLVNNAVKYAPDSKEIYLLVEEEAGFVKVSVKDNGPGIDKERQPHLFKRYYRADHSGKKYSGLGLGLYICSEIISKHKGQIGVTSTEGEGSTFWFKLPTAE